MSFSIPFEDFGGKGDTLHLAHANGFPPRTYQQIVQQLTPHYRVLALHARPLWPAAQPHSFTSWQQGADDLIAFLDQQQIKNCIGVGHSFGAICTVLAANKRPDLFKALVLIEPVVLPSWYYYLSALPKSLVKRLNPLVKKTLERTDAWSNRQQVFKSFRNKKVFTQLSDQALWDYVNAVTSETNNGVALNYSKHWEAQIFLTVTNPWNELKKLRHPFLAVRGQTSDTILPSAWQRWKSINTTGELIEIENAGHLVPLEQPTTLVNEMLRYLEVLKQPTI